MDKRYDHQSCEQKAQEKWLTQKTYSTENNPGTLYSIDTPPPTVSGTLHIGHVFSYTQTDIIARYKRMQGFSVFYPFGFDDNGLPTERYVEKKRKLRAHELSRSEFIKMCLEETKEAEQEFIDLWQRIGLSVDWQHCYSTISDPVRKLSQASFIDLYKKGFVYRKDEPALYCTTCRTSVAQAELDDIELPSFFNDIVFKDEQGNDLIVATTRPELLSSCVAMFYHPNDERYKHLKNTKATVPLFNFEVPIFADEHVDIEKGTGLVMCCTFGDKADIEWFKNFNLPYKQSIGFDGKMTSDTGSLAGLKVTDARKKIIEELTNKNLLIKQKEITHTVNVHERCKKEIEYVVLQQWFIDVLKNKQTFVDLADQINWYPTFMKARYINWVENISWDWCISRQRFYGVPFPLWHCKDCNEVLLADVKDLPIDPQETPYKGTCSCGSNKIQPDTDVMDTWNTSALTPYICSTLYNKNNDVPVLDNKIPELLPMSMRPQAHDIIRTWAFYTITRSWMHHKIIPWKDVIISGHVLSDEKAKLSKSKEHKALTPQALLKLHSADAIRYWTASGSLGQDIAFSDNQLKIGHRLITKLWNAFIFTQPHILALEEPKKLPTKLGAVNEWLLHSITQTFEQYTKYMQNSEFSIALDHAERFFWNDFCDNYVELIKNQLFNPQDYSDDQVYATRWTLYHVGLRILQLFAPYLPHVTETIYQELYVKHEKTTSLHQTNFVDIQLSYVFENSALIATNIIAIASTVRKLKTEAQLSLKGPLGSLRVYVTDESMFDKIKELEQLIYGVTHAQTLHFIHEQLAQPELKEVDGSWHAKVGC